MWPVREIDVKLKCKNVNNKRLFRKIDQYVMGHLETGYFESTHDREYLTEELELFILDLDGGEAITNCRVRFTLNPHVPIGYKPASCTLLTIEFKQLHCENITTLEYTIASS